MQEPTETPMPNERRFGLTIGPLLNGWPHAQTASFYADVADGPADTVVLGELVCSRRNDFKFDDWLALARNLRSAGKQVVLATQALVMSEAEQRSVRRWVEQDEFAVEAGTPPLWRRWPGHRPHKPYRPYKLQKPQRPHRPHRSHRRSVGRL